MGIPANIDSRFVMAESNCRGAENHCRSKQPADDRRVDSMCAQQGRECCDGEHLCAERDDERGDTTASATSRARPM